MAEVNQDYWSQFEDVESAKVQTVAPKFKMGATGDKARIHFPFVNPNNKQVAVKRVTYFSYEDKVAKTWARFQAPADPNSEAYRIAVQHCGTPMTSYVTPVLQYSTNNMGKVVSGIDYKVIAMTLHKTRMQELKQIQDEYNLADIDIGVVCNEVNFQNIKFSPLKTCALNDGFVVIKDRTGLEKKIKMEFTRDEVFAQAQEIMQDADSVVANKWGDQQIIDFFSGDKGIQASADGTPAFDAVDDDRPAWDSAPATKAQPKFDIDEDSF